MNDMILSRPHRNLVVRIFMLFASLSTLALGRDAFVFGFAAGRQRRPALSTPLTSTIRVRSCNAVTTALGAGQWIFSGRRRTAPTRTAEVARHRLDLAEHCLALPPEIEHAVRRATSITPPPADADARVARVHHPPMLPAGSSNSLSSRVSVTRAHRRRHLRKSSPAPAAL